MGNIKSAASLTILPVLLSGCLGAGGINIFGGGDEEYISCSIDGVGLVRQTAPCPPPYPRNASLTELTEDDRLKMAAVAISFDRASDGTVSNVQASGPSHAYGRMIYDASADSFEAQQAIHMGTENAQTRGSAGGVRPASDTVGVISTATGPTSIPPPPPPPSSVKLFHEFTPADIDGDASNDTFRVYQSIRDDGTPINLTMLIPGDPIHNMTYVTLGVWSGEKMNDNEFAFGTLVFGIEDEANVPISGEANYEGPTLGWLLAGNELFSLSGETHINVNFNTDEVNAIFTNMVMQHNVSGAQSQWVDFSSFGIIRGTEIEGTSASLDGSLNGGFLAKLYNSEIGGNWTLSGDGEVASGSFVGKQGGGTS